MSQHNSTKLDWAMLTQSYFSKYDLGTDCPCWQNQLGGQVKNVHSWASLQIYHDRISGPRSCILTVTHRHTKSEDLCYSVCSMTTKQILQSLQSLTALGSLDQEEEVERIANCVMRPSYVPSISYISPHFDCPVTPADRNC